MYDEAKERLLTCLKLLERLGSSLDDMLTCGSCHNALAVIFDLLNVRSTSHSSTTTRLERGIRAERGVERGKERGAGRGRVDGRGGRRGG